MFICLRPPPLQGFCLGVVEQFCRFWIWSVTESKTPAEYGLQHDSTQPTPSQPHTVCIVFKKYFDNREVGSSNQRKGERGNREQGRVQSTKLGRKYQHDWMYARNWLSPVYKLQYVCWTGENDMHWSHSGFRLASSFLYGIYRMATKEYKVIYGCLLSVLCRLNHMCG